VAGVISSHSKGGRIRPPVDHVALAGDYKCNIQ
jgi:hypothetical protein